MGISDSYEKSSAVLHVTALEGSHIDSYICDKLNYIHIVYMEYQQKGCICCVTLYASNMCKAMKGYGPCSYACFTHSLQ